MNQPLVTPLAKKRFIKWFLTHWEFRGEGPRRVLLTLLKQDATLKQVKIIAEGCFLRPLLVVSSLGTGMPPVHLLTYEQILTDPDEIIDFCTTLKKGGLYLTFYFPNRNTCVPFLDVLEELPLPLDPEKIKGLQIDLEIQLLLAEAENEAQRTKLLSQIDEALANREKEKFHRLVKILKTL
ncbi:MAG TPA: IDEAL domain-containing protein [Firmicutes bacterium]|nr:IDEAL domain-containing protein [Bacillota bacterium]